MSFVKGDRVKYTGNGSYNTPGLFGKVGTVKTVEHVHNPIVFVTWDDPNVYPNGVYPANLEKVKEPPFKEGDRVRFTGKHSTFFTNNFRVGKTGTVAEISVDGYASIGVDWDNETRFFPVYHYPENLEKVVAPVAQAFNPGDRVRYTGRSPLTNEPHRVGMLGTVDEVESKINVRVKWDDSDFAHGHFPENLEKVKPMNVSNTSTTPTPDPVQALREQASKIEEISVAWQDVADKLRDSADAMENVSDLINAATNNL